jgi:hypothetical protein
VLPLGHAAALANPDLPYLKWAYMRKDEIHLRNNPEEFTEAVCQMFRWLKAYRADRHKPESEEMPNSLIEKFYHYFRFFESPSAELRHKWWCELIESGEFGINDCISYAEKGSESWLWAALGDTDLRKSKSLELEKPPYFNHTHWKLFHDALKVHRYQILHLVLPRFGIIEYL